MRTLEGIEVFLDTPVSQPQQMVFAALEPDVIILERNSGMADLALALLAPGFALVELDAAQG